MVFRRTSTLPARMLGLLTLMLLQADADSNCPFEVNPLTLDPQHVVVQHGQQVEVNCSSTSLDSGGVRWSTEKEMPDVNNDFTLITFNVSGWDVQPRCIMKLNDTHECSKNLLVTVYKNPDSVIVYPVSATPCVEGMDCQLQCDIVEVAPVQNLNVTWYKGEERIKTEHINNSTKSPVSVSSLLTTSLKREDNGALFTCMAELDLGPQGPQIRVMLSDAHNVSVHYKPVVECPSTFTGVEHRVNLSMACNSDANPPARFEWYHQGVKVDASAPLARGDSGEYVFRATNDLGSANATIILTVEYKPVVECPSTFTGVEHRVNLSMAACNSDANPPARFEWYHQGVKVDASAPLERAASGEYVFRATNELGSANATIILTVEYAPEFQETFSIISVAEGDNVSLHCDAKGNPPPKLQWSSDSGPAHWLNTMENQSDVNITRVHTSTTYNCTATNSLGTITKQIHVNVTKPMTTPAASQPRELCPPVLTPARVVVRYRDTVSVNCSTSSTDNNGMGWEVTSGGTGHVRNVSFVIWRVEELVDWTIQPLCYVTIRDGSQCIENLPVTLYKTPDTVAISLLNHTGPMTEGEKYQLQCDIANVAPADNLTVRWYRGNDTIETELFHDASRFPVNKSSSLSITPSSDDNKIQYRCEAQLFLGPEGPQPPPTETSLPYTATVHYKPLIQSSCLKHYSGVEHNLTLSMVPCQSNGNPPSTHQWYRQGVKVDASAPLERADSGEYVFRATNELGSANATIILTVEYGPTCTCGDPREFEEHNVLDERNLPCKIEGKPKPRITLLKDGKEMSLPMHFTRKGSGEYSVTATNRYGTATDKQHFEVLYAPVLQQINESIQLTRGMDLSLPCSAEGNPSPKAYWNYKSADNVEVTTRGSQANVSIRGATSTNTGIYNCNATNKVGSRSIYITLHMPDYSAAITTVVVVVLLVILSIILIAWCHYRRKHGKYIFLPLNTSDGLNIPMTDQSTGGDTA
ncbi:hemicentin-2 [Polymixia lowei]